MTEEAALSFDALFSNPQRSSLADRILGMEKLEIPPPPPVAPAKKEEEDIDDGEKLRRTAIICNLPVKCTARDLKKLFPQKDSIVNIRFRSIQLENKTKLSRKVAVRRGAINEEGTMNAYVYFKAPADVTDAITRLNNTTFMDKIIRVDQATAPGKKNRTDKETNKKRNDCCLERWV